jgi:Protein of unknown function (DUF3237)
MSQDQDASSTTPSDPPPPLSQPRERTDRDGFEYHPCLSIKCDASAIDNLPLTKVPGGYRLRVVYSGGTVKLLAGVERSPPALDGKVLSGGDWIFIRDDGAASFDTRLTLADSPQRVDLGANRRAKNATTSRHPTPENEFVLNCSMAGTVDLARFLQSRPYTSWSGANGTLRVFLPTSFEASRSAPWAQAVIRVLGEDYDRYRLLVTHQCIAKGSLEVTGGKITSLDLTVSALINSAGGR